MGDAGSNLPSPLLHQVMPGNRTSEEAAAGSSPKVVRSLSRKGERKPADGDGDGNGNAGGGSERPQLLVHGAPGDLGDATGARLVVHTPVTGMPSGKSRRPAPWLDPRRVVFLFATLSTVGTLILLYFTMSMSRTGFSGGGTAASDARR